MGDAGFSMVLHYAIVESGDEQYVDRLVDLMRSASNQDVAGEAARLIDQILGPECLPLFRDLVASPKFRRRNLLIDSFANHGNVGDLDLVIGYAKQHVTGRAGPWGGYTPACVAWAMMQRIGPGESTATKFARWLRQRWHLLSDDEQETLIAIAPARLNVPGRFAVIHEDIRLSDAAAERLRSLVPSRAWIATTPSGIGRIDGTFDAALALSARASSECLRSRGVLAERPVIRMRHGGSIEAVASRRFAKEVAQHLNRSWLRIW